MLWWLLSFIALGFSLFLFWPLIFREAGVSDQIGSDPVVNDQNTARVRSIPSTTRLMQTLVLLVVFVVVALFEYDRLGAFNEIQLTSLLQLSVERPLSAEELNELFTRVDTELQGSTEDVELRFIKGRMYFSRHEYKNAVIAFQQVLDELPATASVDKAAALAHMAHADFFANRQKLSESMRQNLLHAIQLDPEQKTALILLGIDAFARGAYQQAIDHWQALRALVNKPLLSNVLKANIEDALDRLQQQSSGSVQDGDSVEDSTSAADSAAALAYSGLSIRVSLDKTLENNSFPEDAVLFVYAKVAGQPMPVAVKKIVQPEFPVSVVLKDSDSPMPTAKLSSHKQVNLTARLSLTGSIKPMVGDIQNRLENIQVMPDTEQANTEQVITEKSISMVLKEVL